MSTAAASVRPRFAAVLRPESLLPLVLLIASLVAYLAIREVFSVAGARLPTRAAAAVLLAVVVAVLFARIRYQDFPRFNGIFVRWIGIAVLLQVVFDAMSFTPGVPTVLFDGGLAGGGRGEVFFRYAGLLAIAAGVAGWWRPAFLVGLFGFYGMFRGLAGQFSEIRMVRTDFMSMLDTGMLVLVGTLLVITLGGQWTASRIKWLGQLHQQVDVQKVQRNAMLLIWSAAVGAHLANYFWSAVAKLSAGWPEPWTWLFENPTQTSMLMALERGDAALWAFPGVLQLIWDAFVNYALLFNFVVLFTQLFSPLAAIHRRVLLTFTVFFDLFHIAVYFTLGAMFQYWVLVNVLIFISAQHLGRKDFTTPMRWVMAVTTVCAPLAFYVNHLGWLDGAKIASPHFYANTRDGRSVEVPGPYFGMFSYNIAQGRLYVPDGHFPNYQAGNHHNLADWRDALACGPKRAGRQRNYTSLEAVRTMVENTDRFARSHPWYKNVNAYYYYPHHMAPNPLRFAQFNGLSIDDIASYTYRVDSVCLDLRGGRLFRDVRDTWEYRIPAARPAPARAARQAARR